MKNLCGIRVNDNSFIIRRILSVGFLVKKQCGITVNAMIIHLLSVGNINLIGILINLIGIYTNRLFYTNNIDYIFWTLKKPSRKNSIHIKALSRNVSGVLLN